MLAKYRMLRGIVPTMAIAMPIRTACRMVIEVLLRVFSSLSELTFPGNENNAAATFVRFSYHLWDFPCPNFVNRHAYLSRLVSFLLGFQGTNGWHRHCKTNREQ